MAFHKGIYVKSSGKNAVVTYTATALEQSSPFMHKAKIGIKSSLQA